MRAVVVAWAIASIALGSAIGTFAADCAASVSIALTWEGLLRESTSAVVVTPFESRTAWENGRIYSYSHVRVDRAIAGDLVSGSDAWVRTMGGIVGKIGQSVEGEAVLALGQPSVLFLHGGPVGSFEVTARGQGQFPIVRAGPTAPLRVVRSNAVGALVAPKIAVSSAATRLAADVLHGRLVDDVAGEVAANWVQMHAPR